MHIAIILGSIRTTRLSERPAYFVKDMLKNAGHQVTFLDLRELQIPLFADDPEVPEGARIFTEAIVAADAIVIVTPEYNHSYSSALKNAIDFLRKREFMHKPVGCIGVSDGLVGGARALLVLRATLPTLGAIITPTVVALPQAQNIFPDNNTCTNERTLSALKELIRELEVYGKALSEVRRELA
jgi:NAD(P)H-dependent FMN reductase